MEITNLNQYDFDNMGEPIYISEGNDVVIKITQIKHPKDNAISVYFKCVDGPQTNAIGREYILMTEPKKDESGNILSYGGKWKFCKLMIACGFYDVVDGKTVVIDPFDPEALISSVFMADFVRNGEYVNMRNMREIKQ